MSKPFMGKSNNRYIFLFTLLLCALSGFLLALVSTLLVEPQRAAKALDQNKQMLMAANLLEGGDCCGDGAIDHLFKRRVRPLFVTAAGEVFTADSQGIDITSYLAKHKKSGYHHLPLKILWAILPNEVRGKSSADITEAMVAEDITLAEQFVIAVSGFGLWGPIYGYIAVANDGMSVIGTSWYEMAETPGLGANITEPWWQKQFAGKLIFQSSPSGEVDLEKAPMGVVVVKGAVKNVFGNSPKAKNAVDGISGSTLTGDGVTAAYRESLTPYREFFKQMNKRKLK